MSPPNVDFVKIAEIATMATVCGAGFSLKHCSRSPSFLKEGYKLLDSWKVGVICVLNAISADVDNPY